MNGEFDSDLNSQICPLNMESSRAKDSEENFPSQEAKITSHKSANPSDITSQFGFVGPFVSNPPKSSCRGDGNGEVQCCAADSAMCRSVLKESFSSVASSTSANQSKSACVVNVNASYANDQSITSPDSSAVCSTGDPIHNTIESLKALSLKSDSLKSSPNPVNNPGSVKSSRPSPFNALPVEVHSYDFEKGQPGTKLEGPAFMSETLSGSSMGQGKFQSQSLSDASCLMDNNFSVSNYRGQLGGEGDIAQSINTADGHCLSLGTAANTGNNLYWSSPGNNSGEDFNSLQAALSMNSMSPLLSNFLTQQAGNSINGSVSHSPTSASVAAAVAAAAAKRAITGGHQNTRSGLSSRPAGWNPSATATFDQNSLVSEQSGACPPVSSMGMINSKPNWIANFGNGANSCPWNTSNILQQNISKANFNDSPTGSLSCNNGSLRFGLNPVNLSTPGMSTNTIMKTPNSTGLANIYNMFPKRPQHRMMAHWQQQQQHQNSLQSSHLQQASPGVMVNKIQNPVFSCSSMLTPSFTSQDCMQSSSLGETACVTNSKASHNTFAAVGQNPAVVNTISNSLLMPNGMENMGATSVAASNSEKLSTLDPFKFGFDSQLLEVIKTLDANSSATTNLLDDLSLKNLATSDGFQSAMMNQISGVPPPSCRTSGSILSSTGFQNQTLTGMGPPYAFLSGMSPREEGYSRKVFVGGLPPDIDEEEITTAFRRFGPLIVDWPHKTESKAYFPPKGYCFLLFQEEQSVQNLISACIVDENKYYWCVSSPTMKDKPVQIRPWNLADSDFVMDGSQPLDPRKTIFVGGVPRPLRAIELALIMDRLYGGVCYAGIDIDPELKYPKGAGRVAFSNQQSYIAAISARFVQLQHNDIDKRVEVKPYVLDNQMCDECQGTRCGGKFAPFFCANVTCLQYYCEQCWVQIHSHHGREYHKPLVKEGAERPRPALYRW
uniref:RRM domain-containing protein n=1 Tax=Schistocephalus solidus TaxID=70667 RepID=A0A0V0J7I6_SCHSO